jgi:hypothetical protein
MTEIPKCLNPNCLQNALARGLCKHCYAQARFMVKENKCTWEDLENAGKIKPKTKKARNAIAWLSAGSIHED